jgi:hypothetical protein
VWIVFVILFLAYTSLLQSSSPGLVQGLLPFNFVGYRRRLPLLADRVATPLSPCHHDWVAASESGPTGIITADGPLHHRFVG